MILVNTVAFGDGDGWYTEGDFAPFTRIRVTTHRVGLSPIFNAAD